MIEWTPELAKARNKRIRNMHRRGLTPTQIAAELGVTPGSIYQELHKAGIYSTSKRGFASMDPAKLRSIGSKGGKARHQKRT